MPWLETSEDEVRCFHPAFESAASEALVSLGADQSLGWTHHLRTRGQTIPDYVLLEKATGHLRLVVEIKRSAASVLSGRTRAQAFGYALENRTKFVPGAPLFFAVSNLELTILSAVGDARSPLECQLEEGVYQTGSFASQDEQSHRARFVQALADVIRRVMNAAAPAYDVVWPNVVRQFEQHATSLPTDVSEIQLPLVENANSANVSSFFQRSTDVASRRAFLLRPLMAEYLRGLLLAAQHVRSGRLGGIDPDNAGQSVANAIDGLRTIDFDLLFASDAAGVYRRLSNNRCREVLSQYVVTLNDPHVAEMANSRSDSPALLDGLQLLLAPAADQGSRGLAQTDPELGDLLATFAIRGNELSIVDPCCGDGALLLSGYRRLRQLQVGHEQALGALHGTEIDAISARLASVRLAQLDMKSLSVDSPIDVDCADMFAVPELVRDADVVLLNPPFKRYENQDSVPVPPQLREYYAGEIAALGQGPASTIAGQPNLFNYYVEFVVRLLKEGATAALILDNRWYHSQSGESLRRLLLTTCEILGLIEYPHEKFFEGLTIATSIVVLRRRSAVDQEHRVKFVRAVGDPRGTDLNALAAAFHGNSTWPIDWRCREVLQSTLDPKSGWKSNFEVPLTHEFRQENLPLLPALFATSRRGSLQKEGGGLKAFEFPFSSGSFDHVRTTGNGARPFYTVKGRALTSAERETLAGLAADIPSQFRGYALRRADQVDGYSLTVAHVSHEETLEPPALREPAPMQLFASSTRAAWSSHHQLAVAQIESDPKGGKFVRGVAEIVGLSIAILPIEELWVGLREPYAGELVVPRALRKGHRVHLNHFAIDQSSKQVRLSSNFVTYSNCNAVDPQSGLSRWIAAQLIAAFLLSSFGQLQFEVEGVNREGLRKTEKDQLDRIRVLDPRSIRVESRAAILHAASLLPFPLDTDISVHSQVELRSLDELIAAEIEHRLPGTDARTMFTEVRDELDAWLVARR